MNASCAVYGCTNNSSNTDSTIQYYYFPKHPMFLQQWIGACWRPDVIDVNTAQICSIHFDNSCYSHEYKMDYLGNYTKMLKFDSVPTLYLPNPRPVTIKSGTQNFNTEQVNVNDVKEIVVYQVATNNFVKVETQDLKEDEKYNILSKQQLEDVIRENDRLKQNIEEFKVSINLHKEKIKTEQQAIKKLDEEIKKMSSYNDFLQRTSMSLADQKNILSKVFSESQIKILSGKKKIYWSNDDMAMGYTIRHLSNKRCYMYLSKNLNIPLPALSSIKRWSTLKKHEFKNEPKNESKFEDEDSE